VALHALVLAGAAVFYIQEELFEEENVYLTQIRQADLAKLDELERPPEDKDASKEEHPAPEAELPTFGGDEVGMDSGAGPEGGQEGGLDAANRVLSQAMGVGGGSGQRPGRFARAAAARPLAPRTVLDRNVRGALRWLARHQNADGSWSVAGFHKNCGQHGVQGDCTQNAFEGNEQYDLGVTSLALLAFLGAGYTPASKEPVLNVSKDSGELADLLGESRRLTHGQVVKRACKFLVRSQAPNGRLGPEVDRYVYNHMLGTLALCEAFGNTRIWRLKGPAEKALGFIVDSRSPGGGWRYGFRSRDTDSSVTGWAVLVLKSAETAGLEFERVLFDDVRRWFDQVTVVSSVARKHHPDPNWDPKRSLTLTGYISPKDAGNLVSVTGLNEHYAYSPSLTAVMVMAAIIMDGKLTPKAEAAVDSLFAFLPQRWSPQDRESWRRVDFYYWYRASYALLLLGSSEDERWKRWSEALRPALVETQNLQGFEDRCAEGSWEPVDRWSCEGGRVYATAVGALTLQVYHRYPKVLGTPKKERLVKFTSED
jgi:hypothetical protein